MTASKLLTTTVAALTVVGAGLVYAQTTTPPGPGNTPTDQTTNQSPPATTPAPSMNNNMPATSTPAQDTTQRSTTAVPMDAQADRN